MTLLERIQNRYRAFRESFSLGSHNTPSYVEVTPSSAAASIGSTSSVARSLRRLTANPKALSAFREIAPALVPLLGVDSQGYRAIDRGPRDIPATSWQTLLQRSEHLNSFNPIAGRGLQIRTDLVTSGGLKSLAVHSDENIRTLIQAELDSHWALNDWNEKYRPRAHGLGVHGELVRIRRPKSKLPIINGKPHHPGEFRAGTFHPSDIESIALDPWDIETRTWLQLAYDPQEDVNRTNSTPRLSETGPKFMIAHRVRTGPNKGRIVGDALFLPINSVLGMSRGLGDLVPVQEWLDLHQTMLLTGIERAQVMLGFIWHIIKKGATPEQIEQRAAQIGLEGIDPGTIQVTGEDEEWKAIVPELASGDVKTVIDIIFNHSWGGLGLPLHWYTASESVNKASGENMDDPVFMWARNRRREYHGLIALELELALQESLDYGRLKGVLKPDGTPLTSNDLSFTLISVDPDPTRYELAGRVTRDLSQGLAGGLAAGMIDLSDARFIFRRSIEQTGVELPEPDEMPGAEQTVDERGKSTGPEAASILRSEEIRMLEAIDRQRNTSDRPLANPKTVWTAGIGPQRIQQTR